MDFQVGDTIIVTKNNQDSKWNFLLGKIGTVIQTYEDEVLVQFDYDAEWATRSYVCKQSEIDFTQ